jgi:hypothetical protein
MNMHRKIYGICLLGMLMFLAWECTSTTKEGGKQTGGQLNAEYDVAAYVWPSTQDDPLGRKFLWSEGIGEWEIIQKGVPCFKGHYQPRIPLWGYEMGDDPAAMKKKINAAADHGVNVFIFDWYWYDEGPFLESMVNSFVKAPNTDRMKFYLMWANHDVPGNMWNHFRYKTDSLVWQGEVDWENYKIVVDRIIKQYFKQPNYYKIDEKPVFSIFSFGDLVNGFEGLEGTREALDYLRDEVKKAGFPGLHLQVVGRRNNDEPSILGEKYAQGKGVNELVDELGINSVTTYTWKMAGMNEDYVKWAEIALALRKKWDALMDIPYIPCVSIGWDNTPRYPELGMESVVHIGNTPESFTAYLQEAKEFLKARPDQPRLIILNAWNEWVEGSYLEPDMKWGYSYLEAVEKVMSGIYDKY